MLVVAIHVTFINIIILKKKKDRPSNVVNDPIVDDKLNQDKFHNDDLISNPICIHPNVVVPNSSIGNSQTAVCHQCENLKREVIDLRSLCIELMENKKAQQTCRKCQSFNPKHRQKKQAGKKNPKSYEKTGNK